MLLPTYIRATEENTALKATIERRSSEMRKLTAEKTG